MGIWGAGLSALVGSARAGRIGKVVRRPPGGCVGHGRLVNGRTMCEVWLSWNVKMAELIQDCPRCGTRNSTFDVSGDRVTIKDNPRIYEVFSFCRACQRCTIFVVRSNFGSIQQLHNWDAPGSISNVTGVLGPKLIVAGFTTIKDIQTRVPPDHLPDAIQACFAEGAACFAIECFNASAAMFRLCLDLATKSLLPGEEGDSAPNRAQRTRLYDRIDYLLNQNILPAGLRDLAECVREDGNDGAHDGTLMKGDAEDLIDFTEALLERVFTEPERLRLAKERRDHRRAGSVVTA